METPDNYYKKHSRMIKNINLHHAYCFLFKDLLNTEQSTSILLNGLPRILHSMSSRKHNSFMKDIGFRKLSDIARVNNCSRQNAHKNVHKWRYKKFTYANKSWYFFPKYLFVHISYSDITDEMLSNNLIYTEYIGNFHVCKSREIILKQDRQAYLYAEK